MKKGTITWAQFEFKQIIFVIDCITLQVPKYLSYIHIAVNATPFDFDGRRTSTIF